MKLLRTQDQVRVKEECLRAEECQWEEWEGVEEDPCNKDEAQEYRLLQLTHFSL